jgi:F420-non-reducing hydrogenase small subunit
MSATLHREQARSPAPAARPRFAMYWASSCGGCDIAVLNIGELLLEVDRRFEIAFWPAAVDVKYADLRAMPDRSIDLTLLSGGIRNAENEEMAHLLRAKSKILVAFGSCACEGCIPGLANIGSLDQLLDAVYEADGVDNPDHVRPAVEWRAPGGNGDGVLTLPALSPVLTTLDRAVAVDYYMPGCPPESARIAEVLELVIAALDGTAELPPIGSVIGAGTSTCCDECPRERNVKRVGRFVRIQELEHVDPRLCLLEQGLPCNGPATRSGCGALCPAAGSPCIGCYGPADGVVDYGARLMSAFASVVDATEPAEIERILDGIPDPVGQFYRFSLARSLLGGGRGS